MDNESAKKTKKMVGVAIFIAVIVVLQVISTFVKFGSFSITMALAPIVVGAAVYGTSAGLMLGASMGIVVLGGCISGLDPGGALLWAANPPLTAFLCVFKSAAAGYAAGLVYKLLSKKNSYAGVFCAAMVCPVVNTGIFVAALTLFYKSLLYEWAGETSVIYFLFVIIVGTNFILEFAVNAALAPGIARVIKITEKV
ncbi:MAG: ECF transporter S component [Defluviitaleaceae bacterium]|nr:ECF transporter S component [Defluviitaleaceae bacterium]